MNLKEADTSSLFRFIKTFVVHLTAKRALERHCFGTKEHEVNISLLTVGRSFLSIPAGSWPKMQNILRASLLSDPESDPSTSASDADKAIKTLEDKIQTPPEKCRRRSRYLLSQFKKIIEGTPIRFSGGLHCETVLATLCKYLELFLRGGDNADLISICKVLLFTYYYLLDLTIYHKKLLQSGMISASKLCCPVCWELLEILRKDSENALPLLLRGHHSTIYPVELPKWLPDEIVVEMNERFQKHLRQEIEIMLLGAEQRARSRHVTHESESNISVASSTNSAYELETYE